ncbi:hypothetical protein BGZ70_003939 [Mortierella alpina]|uniref:BD-FAE-like domain-containing protein n=1 Tax=Mortierella alpina TaxID=64518 RepID=A0A9P6M503_MORAP|nr:hypothetical protein BGZ70_003939 [Mortierella alpina]
MGIVSLLRSSWSLAYAASMLSTLLLTAAAIKGFSTRNRTANIVLTLLCNQMAELPLTVVLLDTIYSIWLRITGTFHQSTLASFFYYIDIVTTVGLLYLLKRSLDAKVTAQKFLDQLSKESKASVVLPGLDAPRFWQQFLNPLYWPQGCTIYNNIPYWNEREQLSALRSDGWESVLEMALDVYRPNTVEGGDDRPVLAGYPTQLIDCKRALRWIKDEIRIFGGNPNNVVVAGDSSGGHLAALLALTPNLPEFQPGFEGADTSVRGCVAQSASLDLTDLKNYSRHEFRGRFVKDVAKRDGSAESAENLKFLTEHSPLFRISEVAVPFLVIHGDLDVISPVQSARDFVQEFRSKSKSSIDYLELTGAHHCFQMASSPRSWYTTIATAEWLSFNFDRQGDTKQVDEKKVQVHELVEWGWAA